MSYLKYVASATLLLSLAGLAGASPALANTTDTPQGNATVKHLGDDTFDVAHSVMPGYSKVYLVDRSEVAKSAAVGSFQDGVKLIVDSKNPQWQQVEPLRQVIATSAKTAKFSAAKVTDKVAADTVSVNDAIYNGKQPTGDVYLTSTPVDTMLTQANIKGSPIIQMNSDGTIPANSYTSSAINLYCVGAACNYKAVNSLGKPVQNIKGANRYETAALLVKHAHPQASGDPIFAEGTDLGTLLQLTSSGRPVLLAGPHTFSTVERDLVKRAKKLEVYGNNSRKTQAGISSIKSVLNPPSEFFPAFSSVPGITLAQPRDNLKYDLYTFHDDKSNVTAVFEVYADGSYMVRECYNFTRFNTPGASMYCTDADDKHLVKLIEGVLSK